MILDFMELLWAAAGANKRWDNLKPFLAKTGYGTSTRITLGFPLEKLLNPKFQSFIANEVTDPRGKQYARFMGSRGDNPDAHSMAVLAAVDELHLMIKTFDLGNGEAQQSKVQFSVMSEGHYGTGKVRVQSNLNYDKHVELLSDLIGALRSDA